MPAWILYLQALLTPAIALLAVTIGVLQWRTAHQRVVLDLFDRRMEVFNSLVETIMEVVREGRAGFEDVVAFSRATNRSYFLFGDEITSFLSKMRDDLIKLHTAEMQAESANDITRGRAADREAECLMAILTFMRSSRFW